MICGFVNSAIEARIRFAISNAEEENQLIEAVIDTGYTGFLSLPSATITELNLPWSGTDRATLGDGSETVFQVYEARIIWDGSYRTISVNEAETDPLVGMSLLEGFDLYMQTKVGGVVEIKVSD